MWCSTCHQDLPAGPHPVSGRLVCSRCQRPMREKSSPRAAPICDDGIALDEPAAAVAAATRPRLDDWPTRQRVQHLGRALRRAGVAGVQRREPIHGGVLPLDVPHNLADALGPTLSPTIAPTASDPAVSDITARRREGTQIAAWLVVTLGTLVLAGGVGLIAWSLSAGEMHYWNAALGLTLAGQGTLILGLVLVVSRLWRNSRYATGKLQDVHARLGQLQQTADTLAAIRTGGAPTFYTDLVRGASPHVLLANLKGQVDQLAARLGSGL